MIKKILWLLVALCLAIGSIFLYGRIKYEKAVPTKAIKEFEIQGLLWRTIAYYYHPGIYKELYNVDSNQRLISKAKNVGANFLLVRAFYSCTKEGNLIGNDEEAELYLQKAIKAAHDSGIQIFLTPYIESSDFWPEKKCQLSSEEWTKVVLKWARFAEENNVELFAPGFEMAIIFSQETAKDWFKKILPQIREIYHGKITFAEIPYGSQWNFLERNNVFSGYDCVGITIFPWKEYNGEIDLRSFDDLAAHIEERAKILDNLAKKYGISCKIVATLGMDWWEGKEPDPTTRAKGYKISLDILKKYNITGVFLHIWASEPDHLGKNKEVEEMLKNRWTETYN